MGGSIKFLGVCIFLSTLLICATVVYGMRTNTFEFKDGDGVCVLNKNTGDVFRYDINAHGFVRIEMLK